MLHKSALGSLCRRKVEWIDQAENLCKMYAISRTSLSISLTSRDFSFLAKFNSLKLTETHYLLCRYSLHYFCGGLNSYFSKKRNRVFYFEAPPETRGGWSCMLSFCLGRTIIWRTIRSFTVLFKSCIFLENMNLIK